MRTFALVAGLAALAMAAPHPQDFGDEDIATLPDPVISSAPLGGGQGEVVPYDPKTEANDAFVDAVTNATTGIASKFKRSTLQTTDACALPQGSAPGLEQGSTPDSFKGSATLAASAKTATTPSGYSLVFSNKQASVSAPGYRTYKTYSTYDPALAAADCAKIAGCKSFNLYFERDPTVKNTPTCASTNPSNPPTTNIKAAFYGSLLIESQADNFGQYRGQFQVVIAGSNAYNMKTTLEPIDGYTGVFFGDCAIRSPATTCDNGQDALITDTHWEDGIFNADRCAKFCDGLTVQNPAKPCRFFNTYVQNKDGVYNHQICTAYQRSFGASVCNSDTRRSTADGSIISKAQSYGYTSKSLGDGSRECSGQPVQQARVAMA